MFYFSKEGYTQDKPPAEQAKEFIQLAEDIMANTQAMDQALEMYKFAVEADPTNVKANWMAADFHLKTIGKDRAVDYLLKVLSINPDYKFDLLYRIGLSYQYAMEFDKALAYYNRYRNKLKDRDGYRGLDKVELPIVERKIFECENAKEYIANPAHYAIVNVGDEINSEFEDYGPVLNEEEDIMIFTSRRREGNLNQNVASDNKPYEDIFVSYKRNGRWSPAENIGDVINNEFHGSNLALSADGKHLFLYKDDNNGDIYESFRKDDDSWTYPQPLSEYINSEGFKENAVSISPDGNFLFFSSNRPGGLGGLDIYYSVWDPKTQDWSRSKNLGPKINTEYDDDGPFIDYDGKTLYFSSQGRRGMGGHDVYKSEYDSAAGEWGEPTNLGFPINTPDDDIYFVSTKDGKRGYYASVREDGQGYTDIYVVTILQEQDAETVAKIERQQDSTQVENEKKNLEKVETKVTPQLAPITIDVTVLGEDKSPVDAKISLTNSTNNSLAGKTRTDEGQYSFTVTLAESQPYRLSVEADGYVFQNLDIRVPASTAEPQRITRNVQLNKLRVGTRSVLRNIYFDFNKATFQQESYNELNKLENMMAQNPGIVIEISGHTDNIGSKAYNKQLSQLRANAVKDFLVNKGVDPRRIQSVGYGEEKPLASNDDEKEGREFNRRVEFSVLSGQ